MKGKIFSALFAATALSCFPYILSWEINETVKWSLIGVIGCVAMIGVLLISEPDAEFWTWQAPVVLVSLIIGIISLIVLLMSLYLWGVGLLGLAHPWLFHFIIFEIILVVATAFFVPTTFPFGVILVGCSIYFYNIL